jgi:hypothetical protein
MAHTDTQLGQQSNLTSQLESNLVLSMTTKTAQPNPLINPPSKEKRNKWLEQKQ